jgi:hypothetical protein
MLTHGSALYMDRSSAPNREKDNSSDQAATTLDAEPCSSGSQ